MATRRRSSQDYYRGHANLVDLSRNIDAVPAESIADTEEGKRLDIHGKIIGPTSSNDSREHVPADSNTKHPLEGLDTAPWSMTRNLWAKVKYYFFRGVDRDVVAEQLDAI
jgi:hypothetical protein